MARTKPLRARRIDACAICDVLHDSLKTSQGGSGAPSSAVLCRRSYITSEIRLESLGYGAPAPALIRATCPLVTEISGVKFCRLHRTALALSRPRWTDAGRRSRVALDCVLISPYKRYQRVTDGNFKQPLALDGARWRVCSQFAGAQFIICRRARNDNLQPLGIDSNDGQAFA
ncbi:hypothetical protein EVAR_82116_1 [Eumeta japonica]|uniref:Uncharacterized protein n=1 Tax=Eumeta variegata TaxID=151549 RepID=A0A4C1U1K0_EUMVA|nr:hypothetical protein EVAR_82116_1 [Eumeta japonica]